MDTQLQAKRSNVKQKKRVLAEVGQEQLAYPINKLQKKPPDRQGTNFIWPGSGRKECDPKSR